METVILVAAEQTIKVQAVTAAGSQIIIGRKTQIQIQIQISDIARIIGGESNLPTLSPSY
ncbi:MAG: hypothetical protein ACJAVP_003034 [Spirosomataceae bacterium]|jgi:hypothetical protein